MSLREHVIERLEDDGLLHESGCRECWAIGLLPLAAQLALIEDAAREVAAREVASWPA